MTVNKKRRKLPEEDLAAAVAEIINSPITRSNLSFLRPPAIQEEHPSPLGLETDAMGCETQSMGVLTQPLGVDAPVVKPLWQAEGLLTRFEQTRVHPIQHARDVLSAVESRVYALLWGAEPQPAAGPEFKLVYLSLQRIANQARIDIKTVRELLPRLIDKGFIRIEREADVRRNIPTQYRVFSETSVLVEQQRLNRLHVVRTGKGVFYAHLIPGS